VDTLQVIDQMQAIEEIRVQAADWDTYRMKLAAQAKADEAGSAPGFAQTAGGKVITLESQSSASNTTEPRDVVKLSTSGTISGKSNLADLSSQLTALQDDAIAKDKEIKAAEERQKILERQVQNMDKLLKIKNEMLAQKSNPPEKSEASLLEIATQQMTLVVAFLFGLAIAIWWFFRGKREKVAA
jgi:pilus assembly protein FimV